MTDPTENGRGVQQGTGTYNYAGLISLFVLAYKE